MINGKELKTGVSGLGRIAWQYHIPEIMRCPNFKLTAVADPINERTREASENFGVKNLYDSVSSMLKNENLDLLVVASPTSFHAEQASEAFSFGVDVICEKPLAGKLSEAEKIVDNMQKHQRKLMVYQPHRLFQETLTLKSIIKSGILGNIFLVKRSWNDFNRRNDWQAFQKNGGGMLNNYGSHFIDQFIYLFGGDFKSFNASTSRILTCGDAEDFVKVLAVNKNNITFDMEINMSSAFSEHEWLVYGNAGSARLNGSEWEVKYCQPEKLNSLSVQTGLAAENRLYPREDIGWKFETINCKKYNSPGFYDYCYDYFALNREPLIPVEFTMEVMHLLEKCRSDKK